MQALLMRTQAALHLPIRSLLELRKFTYITLSHICSANTRKRCMQQPQVLTREDLITQLIQAREGTFKRRASPPVATA